MAEGRTNSDEFDSSFFQGSGHPRRSKRTDLTDAERFEWVDEQLGPLTEEWNQYDGTPFDVAD